MSNRGGRRKGRPNALNEARELIALLGALSHDGAIINAQIISNRLGIGLEKAKRLLNLVISSGSPSQEYLPLAYTQDSEDEVILISPHGVRGRELRLTRQETTALVAALNTIGVPEDDQIRQKVAQGLLDQGIDMDTIERTLAPLGESSVSSNLSTSTEALLNNESLIFSYRGIADQSEQERHAVPQSINHDRGRWYLEAYDLDRRGIRRFRVDRMSSVRTSPVSESVAADVLSSEPPRSHHSNAPARTVTLMFADERYLNLFEWPGLEIISRDVQRITARIPYYGEGSNWLPAHIAAGGGTITTDDPTLTQKVAEYVRSQLSQV